MNAPGKKGFTIVELLVAAAIVGILMSIISVYFSQQAKVTRQTQARQEVNIKARMVAEMLVQDLQVAGSSVVFDGTTSKTVQLGCSAGGEEKCIDAPGGGAGTKDQVSIVYATSLRLDEPCRRVSYNFNGTTWRRSEVACDKRTETGQLVVNHQPLASNILALNIDYTCADDAMVPVPPALPPENPVPDPATCYSRDSFPRQATVKVKARADDLDTVTTTVELTTSLPNLRY